MKEKKVNKKNSRKNNVSNKSKNNSSNAKAKIKTNPNSKSKSKVISYDKKDSSYIKRFLVLGFCTFFILFLLFIRLGYLQTVEASWLEEEASRQQATSRIITPKRGIIYDSTGKILAASASVDTVTISPTDIKKDNKEKVAKALSEIFELDYEETLAKVSSKSNIETIAKKVEKDKIEKLENWMKDNKTYSGINIDEDSKRYYPYNTLASNLIGFCNTDNIGQEGIELKWDNILSGTPGKITTLEDAASELIPDKNETYTPAENGNNITLTIDANIQTIVEKYLKQACIENEAKYGGTAIIMRPSNGDVLAMATYPDYDLNNPRVPSEGTKVENWDTLSENDQVNVLSKMWRNKAVADTYEPGSTFKIITASVGLEEGLITTDNQNDFLCVGYELVNGRRIRCWKYETTHGYQTLRQALMNSCNPALMQLGKKIGAPTLYKYYEAFGLFDKTGFATSYEANSNFWDLSDVGNIELATMSFGQRFTITPIQLITAVSSIANDGVLMQPRIVKQIENSDTGAITTLEPSKVRTVLSKDTCNKVIDMLESVVNDGTGYLGQVKGYSIAGKTGTAEPVDTSSDNYVASFISIAPSDNPEVVVLLALYGPVGPNGHQGGTIAAPVVSQILSEVLPYLGVPSNESAVDTSNNSTTVLTDVRNKTVAEARKILESAGFKCVFSGSDSSLLTTDQVPKPGTNLLNGSSVIIYSEGNEARVSREVPDLKGMSLQQALSALKAKNLNISITGNSAGNIVSQDPMYGTQVEEGTVINVTMQRKITEAH